MSSFELSKLQAVSAPRALAESDRAAIEARTVQRSASSVSSASNTGATKASGITLEIGAAIDTTTAPLDDDRVAQIRDALRDGSYPLVPTEIADAMIAARIGMGVER
jgi:negative regulator of flagellin synthesis FlgM